MRNDQRGLIHGRRQQRYDREGTTSFEQESYGGGGEYRGDLEFGGFSDQDFGSQGYSGQGYGDRSYGDPDFGGQVYARRSAHDDLESIDGELGATAYERPSDFAIDPDREAPSVQHSGAVEYGDVGDARGFGKTVGGHNYDGRGRLAGSDYEPRRSAGHRGVGPKGYRRSDERMRDDVCEQLADDDLLDARDIEVQVADGIATLTGTVGSREARWHAEEVAADARGIVDVVNRLTVKQLGVPADAAGGGR